MAKSRAKRSKGRKVAAGRRRTSRPAGGRAKKARKVARTARKPARRPAARKAVAKKRPAKPRAKAPGLTRERRALAETSASFFEPPARPEPEVSPAADTDRPTSFGRSGVPDEPGHGEGSE